MVFKQRSYDAFPSYPYSSVYPSAYPSLSPDVRGTSDRPPVTFPQLRACLDIRNILGEILPQVEPGAELLVIRKDPGDPESLPPPVNPVHAPEIPAISHQQMPMRNTTPLLHLHQGYPVRLFLAGIKPVIEKCPGELTQSPVSVGPAWLCPVRGFASLLLIRVPEGQRAIPVPTQEISTDLVQEITPCVLQIPTTRGREAVPTMTPPGAQGSAQDPSPNLPDRFRFRFRKVFLWHSKHRQLMFERSLI